jgi:hypothetical protein
MTMTRTTGHNGTAGTALHVRFNGRSDELTLGALDLDRGASDEAIKQAVAAHYDRPAGTFANHVVVRYEHAIVLRPEAIYG